MFLVIQVEFAAYVRPGNSLVIATAVNVLLQSNIARVVPLGARFPLAPRQRSIRSGQSERRVAITKSGDHSKLKA
jgi:hypothetical protein